MFPKTEVRWRRLARIDELQPILNGVGKDLLWFAQTNGPRVDWHEPDEEGITATIEGTKLDNAGVAGEILVVLHGDHCEDVTLNLASLLALATCAAKDHLLKPVSK